MSRKHPSPDITPWIDLAAGRSIAVVGNAESLHVHGPPLGDEIDGHDIVVRFNRDWPRPETFARSGCRTDVWVCGITRQRDWQIEASKRMADRRMTVWSWFDCGPQPDELFAHGPCVAIPSRWLKAWHRDLGAKTTSGAAFIRFMTITVGGTIQSASLYGFDFYKSQSISRPGCNPSHDPESEQKMLTAIIADNPRIKWA